MKTKIYMGLITIGICCCLFTIIRKNKSSEITFTENKLYNTTLQNQNPYSIFGSDGILLMTEYERKKEYKLDIIDKDKTSSLTKLELDTQTGIATLFDKNGNILAQKQLDTKEQARWLSVDPLSEKYYDLSPYNYCWNNPTNVIDPDGRDSYLLIWFSKDNETGHAGIAIDNYKRQEARDRKGNIILDSKGNPTYEMVKDGTMTYYDLWPNSPIGKTELQSNVKPDYSKGIIIDNLEDLKTKDPTGSRNGNVSAEGRAADGIVQINTTYDQDLKIQGYTSRTANSDKAYNASNFNCSTFAESSLKTVFSTLDASQYVKVPFPLNVMYHNTRITAPNNLYNAVMTLPGAKNIRGPKSVIAKPYLQYYGK